VAIDLPGSDHTDSDPESVESAKHDKHGGPEVIAPSNRITVALPFSQIKVTEASAELRDLTELLCDLVDSLSSVVPEKQLGPLRGRAEALRAKLR
jgi:hypothetical protein